MKYPSLENSKILSFDIETYDPNLIKKGPGVYRKDGHILGVAIADENGFTEYYNLGHNNITYDEKNKNINYLKSILQLPNEKLGANILYDIDWLNSYDVTVAGNLNDIQIAEPLLDEYRISYSLDSLAEDYLNQKKYKNEIDVFCENNNLKGDSRKYLYLMPEKLVKKYAIQDVLLPLEIFKRQKDKLLSQDLFNLYKLEMGLFPLLLQMRKTGVKIDVKKLEESKENLRIKINNLRNKLYKKYGEFNYNSSIQIAALFDKLDINYNLTDKGNPSIDKNFLKRLDHPISNIISEIKHSEKILSTFLENSFTDLRVGNRIHCSFFPMKAEGYGTKSGRFSSANPNLQQIPAKDDDVSRICRSLFIPEDNHYWGKIDYSQIEYRFMAHYASGYKADEIRKQYNDNPDTDYHKVIMDWTGVDRKTAKNLNFGMAYCMGVKTCSETFGWDIDKTQELIKRYYDTVPFIKSTRNNVISVAKGRSYIKTILKRRARVSEKMRNEGKEYVMFNRLIQGSAADIMKKAMVDCYNAGIFKVLKPHLTVHDELDVSIPKTKEGLKTFKEMKHIMENAIKLRVPVIADAEIGSNWADCTEDKYKKLVEEYK